VGLFCQLIRLTRIFECPFRVPYGIGEIPFFIMFGSGAMGLSRQFVLLGRLPVGFVHTRIVARHSPNSRQSRNSRQLTFYGLSCRDH